MAMRIVELKVEDRKYRVKVCENSPGEAVFEAAMGEKLCGTHIASAPEILNLAFTGVSRSAAISEEFYANLRGERKAYISHGFPLLRRGRHANLQISAENLAKECIDDGVPILSPQEYQNLSSDEFLTGKRSREYLVEFGLEEVRGAPWYAPIEALLSNRYIQAKLGPVDSVERFRERSMISSKGHGLNYEVHLPLARAAFEGATDGMIYVNSLGDGSCRYVECTNGANITVLALDDYSQKPVQSAGVLRRTTTRVFSDLKYAWSSSIDAIVRVLGSSAGEIAQADSAASLRSYQPQVQSAQPQSALEAAIRIDAFLDTFADSLGKAKCVLCHDSLSSLPNECLFLERTQSRFVHGGCYQESPRDGPRALQGEVLHVTYRQLLAAAQVLKDSPVRELSPSEFFGQLGNLDVLIVKYRLHKKYQQALKK